MNILCLESKNNMVTCGQIFKASLFMLVNSSKLSPKKWQVIAPIDIKKADFNISFDYDCNVSKFMHTFLSKNSSALANVVLSKDGTVKIKNLLDFVTEIDNIVSLTYINLKIPSLIPVEEVPKYIKKVSNLISQDIKNYYELLNE